MLAAEAELKSETEKARAWTAEITEGATMASYNQRSPPIVPQHAQPRPQATYRPEPPPQPRPYDYAYEQCPPLDHRSERCHRFYSEATYEERPRSRRRTYY